MARNTSDILFTAEYIKNVLYFATVRQGKVIKSTAEAHFFSIDDELVYENYYSDFGPLNLGCVYRYCKMMNEKLKQYLNKQTIVHYTSIEPRKKANGAFLLGCFGVLYLSLSPKEALKPLMSHGQTYKPFQDATVGDSIYTISILDCLHAIRKAKDLNFFNFQDFHYEEYERLDKIQGGDLNWIIPGKFLAFIGPVDYSMSLYHPPEMYLNYFLDNNVKVVIRLNKKMYDSDVFQNAGINHYDLFFPDGSCPPRHILFKFLQITEETDGAIAVHCKAGLGRTGSLIGCYLMKHYRMTALEAIGWMRICRPGSVIGHQQGWLEQLESWLIKQGNLYRRRHHQDIDRLPAHEFGVYSITEKTRKMPPVVFAKSPSSSPPPPLQRPIRSDLSPPVRPQASRIKDAASKILAKDQINWRMKPPSQINSGAVLHRGDESANSRRNNGGGEPRTASYRSGSRSPPVSGKTRDQTPKKNINYQSLPAYHAVPEPTSMLNNKNHNSIMQGKRILSPNNRDRQLNTSITVTPQYSPSYNGRSPVSHYNGVDHMQPGKTAAIPPSKFYAVSRSPTQPQNRRRLGRSPSPPRARNASEQTRATNTPRPEKLARKDLSKITISEALSKLKTAESSVKATRDGWLGAASVGAASLGARREAPAAAALRAPSVRSDERPLATQGDMLNSIKFQRRYRNMLHTDKNNQNTFQPQKTIISPNMSLTRTLAKIPRGTVNKQLFQKPAPENFGESSTTRNFFSPARPTSPRGRRGATPN